MQHFRNYIAGEWRSGHHESKDENPSDLNDVVASFAQGDIGDVDIAVEAARHAQKLWARVPLERRCAILNDIGGALIARATELATLLSREEGKTLPEGVGEVQRAGALFQFYGSEALKLSGDAGASLREGIDVVLTREPIGVVAVISPWNFPIATASWKIAPALAFGNAVIWKPANLTPAIAWALTDIISKQPLPKGLFSLIMGAGSDIGNAISGHPGIDAVSFTGSLDVGRQVGAAAIANITRFQLELGSKNPLLVAKDADLDIAVRCAIAGGFSGTGQKCTASSRLIVHEAVHDAFVEKFITATSTFKLGHALDNESQMGPLASASQLAIVQNYIEIAKAEGCELAYGGEQIELATPGHYLTPTIMINGRSRMRTNQEEIFGPMVCVIKAGSYEEGLAIANDTEFGLSAAVISRSLATANHFRQHAQAGCVMVNLPTTGTDYHFPFMGRKKSSFGPGEQASAAKEFYTQTKTSYVFSGEPDEHG